MIRPFTSTARLMATAALLSTIGLACGKHPESQENRAVPPPQKEISPEAIAHPDLFLPLIGHYEGTLTSSDGTVVQKVNKVNMRLVSTQRRFNSVEVPTLSGSVNILFNDMNASDVIPIAEFSNASYSPETGRVQLGGTMNTRTLVGAILNTFDGTFADGVIRGQLSNSTRGDLGQLEVRKINSVTN